MGRCEREGERIKGGQTETHRETRVGLRWKGKELHKTSSEAQSKLVSLIKTVQFVEK